MNEKQYVWVVTCEQGFANYFCVIGVFSSEEKAKAACEGETSFRVERFELDYDPEANRREGKRK